MEDRLQPKTAPQCTREPYTTGVLEAPAGYSGQAARTGRTVFMSGPVFGGRSRAALPERAGQQRDGGDGGEAARRVWGSCSGRARLASSLLLRHQVQKRQVRRSL